MNRDDSVPLSFGHSRERLVAQDPRVGNENMHSAKVVEGRLDDGLAVFRRANRSDSLATS